MGKNKALVAVAHSLLVVVYHVLAKRADYRELGGDYFDHQHQQTQQQRLVRKREAMGLKVTVEALPNAAGFVAKTNLKRERLWKDINYAATIKRLRTNFA
jgi:hypothetical protein